MRVLGAESAADPTAVEAEVRRQMAERQAAHDDRNVARMLTPAERRDKKVRKLFDESGVEALTAVYRWAGGGLWPRAAGRRPRAGLGALLLARARALVCA
jgi:U4/U6 small nuclear ribonucleoprotein PRP3